MTWLDRILWPVLVVGGSWAYALFLAILPLTEALLSVVVGSREVVVLSALVLAVISFAVSDSRLRLHVWQATCDAESLKRSKLPTVNLRIVRSKPSDWDDA